MVMVNGKQSLLSKCIALTSQIYFCVV